MVAKKIWKITNNLEGYKKQILITIKFLFAYAQNVLSRF